MADVDAVDQQLGPIGSSSDDDAQVSEADRNNFLSLLRNAVDNAADTAETVTREADQDKVKELYGQVYEFLQKRAPEEDGLTPHWAGHPMSAYQHIHDYLAQGTVFDADATSDEDAPIAEGAVPDVSVDDLLREISGRVIQPPTVDVPRAEVGDTRPQDPPKSPDRGGQPAQGAPQLPPDPAVASADPPDTDDDDAVDGEVDDDEEEDPGRPYSDSDTLQQWRRRKFDRNPESLFLVKPFSYAMYDEGVQHRLCSALDHHKNSKQAFDIWSAIVAARESIRPDPEANDSSFGVLLTTCPHVRDRGSTQERKRGFAYAKITQLSDKSAQTLKAGYMTSYVFSVQLSSHSLTALCALSDPSSRTRVLYILDFDIFVDYQMLRG